MAHIHIKDNQHDLTVTAFIVRLDADEPRALLHMHRKLHRLLPVGGHVELLESPWKAVAHELQEESGYNLSDLRVLQPSSRLRYMTHVTQHPYPVAMNTHDIPDKHFHTDIEYAFVTTVNPSEKIMEGESSDLRWLTQKELNNLDGSDIFVNIKEIYNFIFDEALKSWEQVNCDTFMLNFPDEYIAKD